MALFDGLFDLLKLEDLSIYTFTFTVSFIRLLGLDTGSECLAAPTDILLLPDKRKTGAKTLFGSEIYQRL